MITTLTIALLGMFAVQTTEPPGSAGKAPQPSGSAGTIAPERDNQQAVERAPVQATGAPARSGVPTIRRRAEVSFRGRSLPRRHRLL